MHWAPVQWSEIVDLFSLCSHFVGVNWKLLTYLEQKIRTVLLAVRACEIVCCNVDDCVCVIYREEQTQEALRNTGVLPGHVVASGEINV